MNLICIQATFTIMLILEDSTRLEKSFSSTSEFLEAKSKYQSLYNNEEYDDLLVEFSGFLEKKAVLDEKKNYYLSVFDIPTETLLLEYLEDFGLYDSFYYESGQIYLTNCLSKIPIPPGLLKDITESETPKYLLNFWRRASANPDTHVTNRIYDFVANSGFRILPNGCFIAFRGNKVVEERNTDIPEHLDEFIETIKKRRKGLGTYVYDPNTDAIVPTNDERLAQGLKTVFELNELRENGEGTITKFTDRHSGTMDIRLGSIVSIDRALCDNDPSKTCSKGLHLGDYSFGVSGYGKVTANVCDPYSVVSIPYEEANKLRTCMYFPFAVVEGDIKDFEIDVEEVSKKFDHEVNHLLTADVTSVALSEEQQAFVRNYGFSFNLQDLIKTMSFGTRNNLDSKTVLNTINNRYKTYA